MTPDPTFTEARHGWRHMPAVLAHIDSFEAAHTHACSIEAKARLAIDAFRDTERKWEKINGK